MHSSIRTFLIGGLVLTTGPFSLHGLAQDYIDVEAERAAQRAQQAEDYDPYKVKPAQQYPSTRYGVGTGATGNSTAPAPAATAPAGAPSSPRPTAPGPGIGSQNQNLGNLVYQIQQLQQEVMTLNGRVEKQAYEIRRLQQQLDARYQDLDRRLGGSGSLGAGAVAGSSAAAVSAAPESEPAPAAASARAVPAAAPARTKPRSARPAAAEQPGEGEAYRAAYALVRGQQWDAAISAFNEFLQAYPAGRYAPNAHYWLGELYLVTSPPQLESARQSFMLLLSEYPDNNKVPDAMYKLGKVYYQKGNRATGREYLDRVIEEYGKTNSSAVQLSRQFIAENY